MLDIDAMQGPSSWVSGAGIRNYYWTDDDKANVCRQYITDELIKQGFVVHTTRTTIQVRKLALLFRFNKRVIVIKTNNGGFDYFIHRLAQLEITSDFIILNKFIAIRYV